VLVTLDSTQAEGEGCLSDSAASDEKYRPLGRRKYESNAKHSLADPEIMLLTGSYQLQPTDGVNDLFELVCFIKLASLIISTAGQTNPPHPKSTNRSY
jgi:hypothetical protein